MTSVELTLYNFALQSLGLCKKACTNYVFIVGGYFIISNFECFVILLNQFSLTYCLQRMPYAFF